MALKRARSSSFRRYPRAVKRAKVRRAVKRSNFRKNAYALKRYTPRSIVNTGSGFPDKMVMTHKYCDKVNVQSTAGTIGNYLFSCNGMYDPNITGTGHQPYYFDQMAAIYDQYTVIMSRCKISFWANETNASGIGVCLSLNDDTTVTNTAVVTLQEQTGSKMKIAGNVSDSIRSLVKYWGARKSFGSGIMANNDLQGTAAANPTEQMYYVVSCQSLDGISTQDIWVTVEITYTAVWTEKKDLNTS